MFGAPWSEHCGYKHTTPLFQYFPTTGPRIVVPIGEENAGVVDIGQGMAVVFKMESHNHPSAVEPFQGAATGVGGIVRDILAMGARPIALMNSLRFGPLSEPRNRYLFDGVVGGISWYGNCIGIPDVGGEVVFSPTYTHNPLVNALCVGLVEKERMLRAAAGGEGNVLLLVGADTGRDGIHGSSGLASRTFEDETEELRPTVQVGNPFLEKVLIEACLEVAGTPYLEGLQDLGAAGLTSSTVEAAERGGGGVVLDLDQVHRREEGMTPYEIMLSESQERMLLVVKAGHVEDVEAILRKWDLPCVRLGEVRSDGMVRIHEGGKPVVELPVKLLTDPPRYRRRTRKPPAMLEAQSYPMESIPEPAHKAAGETLLRLLASPNIASKVSVYRQYDHQVQDNTVVAPGADAAVIRIKDTRRAIAISTDGNGRLCFLDPHQGGAIAVAEGCRNVSCVGAEPIALTDCLNFGDPEKPEGYYQLEWCVRGIGDACHALDVPVVSGNASLYNETRGEPIYPTPVVGVLGLIDDVNAIATPAFAEGETVVLLGTDEVRGRAGDLSGSEYLELVHGKVVGRPRIDLEREKRVQALCRRAIREGTVVHAHDCSDGGLAVALAEACIAGGSGFQGDLDVRGRWDAALFGEAQSRIAVSVRPESLGDLRRLATEEDVPLVVLGTVGGKRFKIRGLVDLPLDDIDRAWRYGLEELPD
jgi:phosphoribosylformylglycinamidine synthase